MKTILTLFDESCKKFATKNFVYQKTGGAYIGYTFKQIKQRVDYFGAGLLKLGIDKNDRVALLAEGQLDWLVSELGILSCAGINVPLSVKLNYEEIIFRLNHAGVKYFIISENQLKKISNLKQKVRSLEKIIIVNGIDNTNNDYLTFQSILDSGKIFLETNKTQFEDRKQEVTGKQYANICYTSGTTAEPKGIILTHRNYTANVEQSLALFDVPASFTTLLILPWDHAFAHTVGIYPLMKNGASIACIEIGKTPNETLRNIPKNIKESKPVFLLSVPSLAKNFRKNIEKSIAEKGGIIEKLFNYGLKLGYKYNGNGIDQGKGAKKFSWPMYKLIDSIIFKKIRQGFGGKLEFFVGGGALLDIELQRFFCAIGMPMLQGYGLTEASPVISSNTRKKFKFGTSGILVPNMELKICDEDGQQLPQGEKGEIVIKGENVMAGYWNNQEATNSTIKNGWLYTGDLGYMDSDGFLMVLGRSKSLLIADDGEKYSPEGIEEAFSDNSKLIDQCMLYNNQNAYTIALVFPNKAAMLNRLNSMDLDLSTTDGRAKGAEMIQSEINEYRAGGKFEGMFPDRWLPAAIGLLHEGFTEENKLMNSTMKMIRPKVTERHMEYINFLYTPEAKKIGHQRNLEALNHL